MSFQRVYQPSSQDAPNLRSSSPFAPRSFSAQATKTPSTQEKPEIQSFEQAVTEQQHSQNNGTIKPGDSDDSSVLQAKLDRSQARLRERASEGTNLLEILIRNSHSSQTIHSGSTVQRQTQQNPEVRQSNPLVRGVMPNVQRQTALEDDSLPVQRSLDRVAPTQAALEKRLNANRGGGSPLPDDVRSSMEPHFGADFSQVRVHTGSDAIQMNRDLNAQAFTHGQDVYFGAGSYNPTSSSGKRLLAHELTHVVQQSGAASIRSNTLQRQQLPSSPPVTPAATVPAWTREETIAIQRQLRRLGLYQIRIDGIVGAMTESGLVEAFGSDEWRTLDAATVTQRLTTAQITASGRAGEHRLRYGEMFRDGVLDMTLGIGFDEEGHHRHTITAFQEVLQQRGFQQNPQTARRIYQQAGRAIGNSAFGLFFVRENALTFTPPAGTARQIHAVVRLVFSEDGSQGGAASSAFREGMSQSDVAYYSGHGRYGSGPDFDRNFMSFDLLDRDGTIERTITDYTVLERVMRNEGARYGRSAWQQFLWRVNHNRINVMGANQGNVFVNPTNRHRGEFGSRLIYWSLQQQGGAGAAPVTGSGSELAQGAADHPERRYRLMVFDGCRTQDYVTSIRSTPGYDSRSTDILATRRTVDWGDEVGTLATFLDSVLGQQSAEQVIRGMDAQQGPMVPGGQRGGAYSGFGLQDNPTVR